MRGSPFCVARAVARTAASQGDYSSALPRQEKGERRCGVVQRQMERIESRQASFLAAPALTRRREKLENERKQRLRAAGCTDPDSEMSTPLGGQISFKFIINYSLSRRLTRAAPTALAEAKRNLGMSSMSRRRLATLPY